MTKQEIQERIEINHQKVVKHWELLKAHAISPEEFNEQIANLANKDLSLISDVVKAVIGEDEYCPCKKLDCPITRLNALRSEQEAKRKELLG